MNTEGSLVKVFKMVTQLALENATYELSISSLKPTYLLHPEKKGNIFVSLSFLYLSYPELDKSILHLYQENMYDLNSGSSPCLLSASSRPFSKTCTIKCWINQAWEKEHGGHNEKTCLHYKPNGTVLKLVGMSTLQKLYVHTLCLIYYGSFTTNPTT